MSLAQRSKGVLKINFKVFGGGDGLTRKVCLMKKGY